MQKASIGDLIKKIPKKPKDDKPRRERDRSDKRNASPHDKSSVKQRDRDRDDFQFHQIEEDKEHVKRISFGDDEKNDKDASVITDHVANEPPCKSNYDSTSDSEEEEYKQKAQNFEFTIDRRGLYEHDVQGRLPENQSPANSFFQKNFFLPQMAKKISFFTDDLLQLSHSNTSRVIITSKKADKPKWKGLQSNLKN